MNRMIPYRKLLSRMALMGIRRKEVATLLGVHYSTLMHKLRGETAFTLEEALILRKALGFTCAVEDVFEKATPEEALAKETEVTRA